MTKIRSTTILAVRSGGKTAIAGDGQVTMGQTMMKSTARKVRRIGAPGREVICGFAGTAADGIALLEKLESKLGEHGGSLPRAAVELAKDWRTDRVLRRLDALLVVADAERMFLLSGTGDVIEPDGGVTAIGSGGAYALAAARALIAHTKLSAREIATSALGIAADICIYTNREITVEEL